MRKLTVDNFLLFAYILYLTWLCCCAVAQSCLTLCDPMDGSTPGFPVLHHLPELAQPCVHWVGDAIPPSHPLSSPSPPALNLSSIRVFSDEPALPIGWLLAWLTYVMYHFHSDYSNTQMGLLTAGILYYTGFSVFWFFYHGHKLFL